MPAKKIGTKDPPVAPSLARLRKQRQRSSSAATLTCIVLGGAAALGLAVMVKVVFLRPRPEDHEQFQEALKTLRADDLEATTENVHFALRMIDAATGSYSERGFRVVDPRDWQPQCRQGPRVCRSRPQVADTRQLPDGSNLSLLELEGRQAKVWVIEDLVSEAEAAVLLGKITKINFTISPTNHVSGQEWRSSSSSILSRDEPEFRLLLQRVAAICRVPLTYLEAPQVVRYMPGEQYRPHLDSAGPDHRHWTVLLYLNDPGRGGATGFPLLQMKVNPAPRAAVFWENLRLEHGHAQPKRNYYTLHDGQAPSGSEPKYAVNIWVRNAEYVPGV